MATFAIVKFKNMSPLHIGDGRDVYDTASQCLLSDTISSALASLYAQQGGDNVLDFMNSFTVSSAFPYSGECYYLPKPMGRLDICGCDVDKIRKTVKKIKYIDYTLWRNVANGAQLDIDEQQLKGEFLVAKSDVEDFEQPYKTEVHQRVGVSRDGGDAAPFFFEWKYFAKDAGLFCMFNANEENEELVKRLFVRLGECGIGSDRSVGGGMFEVEFDTITLPDVADANAVMLLSQYIPTKDEHAQIAFGDSRYELSRRGGYMAGSNNASLAHLIKQAVYMFNTASVLKMPLASKGKVVDLAPVWNSEEMHPVYRSGRCLALPIKITDL